MRLVTAVIVAVLAAGGPGRAAEDVVVGAIYPAAGPAAALGSEAKLAVETALDIVNGQHEAIGTLMGRGGGIDRLGGARLRVAFADDGGDPATAAAEAERLIASEHVVALIGGASDATAEAISEVAERHAIPHLSFDAAATGLSLRDQSWFFRINPSRSMAMEALMRFLGERHVQSLALVAGSGAGAGESIAAARKLARAGSMTVVADLAVAPGAALAAEALAIAGAKPDAVVASLAAGDAVTLLRQLTAQHVGSTVAAAGSGFASPEFLAGLGAAADTVFATTVFATTGFAADAVRARPALPALNAAFKARSSHDLDEASARTLTGVLLLADVIDRAGSTKPIDLRTALMATDVPGEQTPMAWPGIRFDTTGQNVLAVPAVRQVQGGAWVTVSPEAVAAGPVVDVVKR